MIEWDVSSIWRQGFLDAQENFAKIKWTSSEGPRDGYIDAGVSLVGGILITHADMEDISWPDAKYLDELVGKWNLEYLYDPILGSYQIRSAVPCITSLEA